MYKLLSELDDTIGTVGTTVLMTRDFDTNPVAALAAFINMANRPGKAVVAEVAKTSIASGPFQPHFYFHINYRFVSYKDMIDRNAGIVP